MAERRTMDRWLARVWPVQAAYFLITGVWAVVGIRSFQKISGPKTDIWLVRTVGLLTAVIGSVLALAGWRHRTTPEVAVLAVGSSAALAAIDVTYTVKGRISRVYLLDACANIMLIAGWLVGARRRLLPCDTEPGQEQYRSRPL